MMPLRPVAPEWLPEDAARLAAWLNSESGRKLVVLLQHYEQHQNASAVMRATPWACGFAAGWRAMVAWQMTLAASLPPEAQASQGSTQEGREELLEKYSP
jgi:hypothetical protein